jgi:hypothetical protein
MSECCEVICFKQHKMKIRTSFHLQLVKSVLGQHARLVICAIIISLSAIQNSRGQDCQHFYERLTPFGSGDRLLKATIRPCDAGSPADVDLYVFYSTDQSQLNTIFVGSSAPHGKARYVKTTDNRYEYEFIFPHTTHLHPNTADDHAVRIADTSKVYFRLLKRTRTSTGIRSDRDDLYSFKMPYKMTIANAGDSYAAGEGAPVVTGDQWSGVTEAQRWTDGDSRQYPPGTTPTDIDCHRSRLSGQTMAVIDLIDSHPEVAIDFRNVACSGAVIVNLWSSNDDNREVSNPHDVLIPFQFNSINSWLSANQYPRLDILMLNIGGNDLGFGDIVFDFLMLPLDFSVDSEAQAMIAENISTLPALYDALNVTIHSQLAMLPYCKPVIISTFPSPTRGPFGFCDAENESIHKLFVVPANQQMSAAAAAPQNDWDIIDMENAAGNHGFCASDNTRFFNKSWEESLAIQGDVFGIAHPNARGHFEMYRAKWNEVWDSKLACIRSYFDGFRALSEEGRALKEGELQEMLTTEKQRFAKRLSAAEAAFAKFKALRTKYAPILAKRKEAASEAKRIALRKPPRRTVPKFPIPRYYLDYKFGGDIKREKH